MSEIQSKILRWQQGEISGDGLLRALVDFQHWLVPISECAMSEALSNNAPPAISYNRNEQGEDSRARTPRLSSFFNHSSRPLMPGVRGLKCRS
jgi:hypothetical protein